MSNDTLDIIKSCCNSPDDISSPMEANALLVHAWIIKNFKPNSKQLNEDWKSKGPLFYNFKYACHNEPLDVVINQIAQHIVSVQLFFKDQLRSVHFPIDEAVNEINFNQEECGEFVDKKYKFQGISSVLKKLSDALLPQAHDKAVLEEPQSSESLRDVEGSSRFEPFVPPVKQSSSSENTSGVIPRLPTKPEVPVPEGPLGIPSSRAPAPPAPLETPPGFEDEYQILHNSRAGNQSGATPSPFAPIGSDDLYPPEIGRDPLLSSTTHPLGRSHEGMYPGPSHPIFGGHRQEEDGTDDFTRPPGARWDPTGPFEGGGRRRGPGGPGGFGSSGFGSSGFGGPSGFI